MVSLISNITVKEYLNRILNEDLEIYLNALLISNVCLDDFFIEFGEMNIREMCCFIFNKDNFYRICKFGSKYNNLNIKTSRL